jgi:hypothetical protein
MSELNQTVSPAQVVSTFGTSFWLRSDSATDYCLHPTFLRFVMLALGIYTLMDQSDDAQLLVGWQLPVMWLATALTILSGFIFLGGWALTLFRRGILRRIYTPFLMLPIIVLAELTEQSVVQLLQAGDWKTLPNTLTDLTRDMMVIMLMDVMHVQYVVPNHPLASLVRGNRPTLLPRDDTASILQDTWQETAIAPVVKTESEAEPETEDEPRTEAQHGAIVRIADRRFSIADIQSVRTEDHYLNVVTRTGRSMVRAKLSDLDTLHDGRHGVQINRSQWVAFSAIESVKDEANGQIILQMVNGDSATVSRTRRLMFMQLYNTQRSTQP